MVLFTANLFHQHFHRPIKYPLKNVKTNVSYEDYIPRIGFSELDFCCRFFFFSSQAIAGIIMI